MDSLYNLVVHLAWSDHSTQDALVTLLQQQIETAADDSNLQQFKDLLKRVTMCLEGRSLPDESDYEIAGLSG
jgi:hypothetical protein